MGLRVALVLDFIYQCIVVCCVNYTTMYLSILRLSDIWVTSLFFCYKQCHSDYYFSFFSYGSETYTA